MPTTCEIEFDNNPLKVMYSGQVLRGNVKLTLTESIKVRCVYLKIVGEGYCHWTNEGTFTGRESYIDESRCFVDGSEGDILKIFFPKTDRRITHLLIIRIWFIKFT